MYQGNYLAGHIRAASIGRESAPFATLADGNVMTYGDLFAGAEKYAALLAAKGVQAGDRVAVQADKSVAVLQVYIATILCGGVFLPLNTAYTSAEVEYFLSDAAPRLFICSDKAAGQRREVAERCSVAFLETLNADGSGSLPTQAAQQQVGFSAVARNADDLAAILYTSGTTGRSKGAMLSHGNLWSNADTLKEYWHFSSDDVLIHALPIFHTHGLFVATNVTLAAGSSLIFMTRFDVDGILNAMDRATVLMGVPTFYVRLLRHEGLTRDKVRNMRLFVSGSAPLLAETADQWTARTGHAILERYGMTETSMNTSNPYHGDRRPGTVGYPLPDVEVRIVEPDSREVLPQGAIGSIEVRGPNVFLGYWQMPEKTREELKEDGFFITGDLGLIDEHGYVSISGRAKDLIISGGYNVYPKELELLIDDIPGVDESAVIGLPHPDFGEGVAAVVVKQAGADLTEADVMDALQNQVARYKQPKKVFFVEELPRNTMGKVQKKLLRETYNHCFTSGKGASPA